MTPKEKNQICRNWNLYVITDINMAAPRSYPGIIREVLMGGANVIQLRDKSTPFENLVDIGKKIKPLFEEFGATFIINDNPYLAKEINADGVHIGQDDIPVDIAREIVGDDKIIGLSTHSKMQALNALSLDVDYIGIGPVFPTSTKPLSKSLGIDIIKWADDVIPIPFVPIGGINKENISEISKICNTSPALVSAVMKSSDISEATSDLINIIKEARQIKK
jgi:thiamine-phosphate pyrophosphorylase